MRSDPGPGSAVAQFLGFLPEHLLQPPSPAIEARHDRADRDVEDVGDLAVREALNIGQEFHLAELDRQLFQRRLDRQTERLRRALPQTARHWGLSRKLLNIFLRDALYTGYLSDYYRLSVAERFFEVPLDSISGKAIRKCRSGAKLPRWQAE